MRSRTSRGVPEWSGGKELYIGSAISAVGTSFGVTGIVPGPPEGSRGPTGWGHMGSRGCTLAYMGQGHQPQEAHAPGETLKEESQQGKAPPRCLGGEDSSPGRRPLGDWIS